MAEGMAQIKVLVYNTPDRHLNSWGQIFRLVDHSCIRHLPNYTDMFSLFPLTKFHGIKMFQSSRRL